MLRGFGDRRVATPAGSEPVTRSMERRLPARLEHLPDRLTDHPVDHVRDSQPALPAASFGNHRPANHARSIPPRQQVGGQLRALDRPLLADRLPVWAGCSLVRDHFQQRCRQPLRNLLHRHRDADLCIDDRLRLHHPAHTRTGPGPRVMICCRDRQFELHRRLINRDRLPLPTGTRPDQLDGNYPVFQYYAILRLLLGHRVVVLSFSDLPASNLAGTQQISRDKTQRFRCDHVANTPSGPTGIARRRREPAHPPKERLTALHFRSQPHRTYDFLQTRPHGSSAAPPAALEPPGELRAAPLPLRCWVPPVRAPGQDFHLRSHTPCPAYSPTRPSGAPRRTGRGNTSRSVRPRPHTLHRTEPA